MDIELIRFLLKILGPRVFLNEPLAGYTTWNIGGRAWCLARTHSSDEAAIILAACRGVNCPVKVLGRGSNLLVQDTGYPGVILKLTGPLASFKARGRIIKAGGGACLSAVVKFAASLGLSGLEWAIGIPGSVGGAIATNAGAYGTEIAEVVTRVILLSANGDIFDLAGTDLSVAYRQCDLPIGSLVLEAHFLLTPTKSSEVVARGTKLLAVRRRSQPLNSKSAGSVFKNPSTYCYAGWFIDAAGLKGSAVGRAQVSYKHANFIINQGGAKASEVLLLMSQVQNTVKERFGVELIPEIEILGNV